MYETKIVKHQLACNLLLIFRGLGGYSRFVKRCNSLLPCIQLVRQVLVFQKVQGIDISIIDSFPIPLCHKIRNCRGRVLPRYINIGYNATKNFFYGCKYHALVSESGYIWNYNISEASKADSRMAELLLESYSTSTVPGDKSSLGEAMHNRLAIRDIQLITTVRKNMKRKMIAFPQLSKRRKVIE